MNDRDSGYRAPEQPWAKPLVALDRKWTALESSLALALLAVEITVLLFIVSLKGFSVTDGLAGRCFRTVLGAFVAGGLARLAFRKDPARGARATAIAFGLGALLGAASGTAGAAWVSNIRSWIGGASALALTGGAPGLAKRLTLWLALLGASLATARGKHVSIDIGLRLLPKRAKVPAVTLGWLLSAVVAFAAVAGFADHLATSSFGSAPTEPCESRTNLCDVPLSRRVSDVTTVMRRDLFLLGRQASLDLMTLPRVLGGERFDAYLTKDRWNAWVDQDQDAWARFYPSADVAAMKITSTDPTFVRPPMLIVPGGADNPQELLLRDLNLIVPGGLFMIGLRFLLRALLALTGFASVDPNQAHEGERDVEEEESHAAGEAVS